MVGADTYSLFTSAHSFYLSAPPFQAIPEFLRQTEYKNPGDGAHTPFHLAFHTNKSLFEWLADHPDNLAHFNNYMALHRKQSEGLSWLSVYPVEAEAAGWPAEQPVYVDVGGGIGHQCAQLREKLPDLPGRVVLQDLPHSIARALPTPGVENMAHDFFHPQPVIGTCPTTKTGVRVLCWLFSPPGLQWSRLPIPW